MKGRRAQDGDEGPIDDLPPAGPSGDTGEDHNSHRPQGDLHPHIVDEEHPARLRAESCLRDRQREVAVIVNAGGEGEGAPLP